MPSLEHARSTSIASVIVSAGVDGTFPPPELGLGVKAGDGLGTGDGLLLGSGDGLGTGDGLLLGSGDGFGTGDGLGDGLGVGLELQSFIMEVMLFAKL